MGNSQLTYQPKDYIDKLPRLRFLLQEFLNLPDYSATYPTGTTPGKVWRRLDGAFDRDFIKAGGKPYWMVMQYDPDCPKDAKTTKILRFKPIIVVKAEGVRRADHG
jgi:hypothetical protein